MAYKEKGKRTAVGYVGPLPPLAKLTDLLSSHRWKTHSR